jgi:threonine/homoserine/homoserine lactone efflux protein
MIAWEFWIPFLGYAVPMVISPGPGNAVLATAGGRLGLAGSVPFWVGFEAANIALCLTYGFGLAGALQDQPGAYLILKWAGVLYLLYLAWGFFRTSVQPSDSDGKGAAKLSFGAGFLLVTLNPKIHSMILVMFSQFLDPSRQIFGQVLQITLVFLIVCIVCHFPWIYGGKVILSRFQSDRALRVQGWTFGSCMVAVATYVAFH